LSSEDYHKLKFRSICGTIDRIAQNSNSHNKSVNQSLMKEGKEPLPWITGEQIMNLWNKQGGCCAYSDIPMGIYRGENKNKFVDWEDSFLVGKERVHDEPGYRIENMVLVCREMNASEYFRDDVDGYQGWSREIVTEIRQNFPENYSVASTPQWPGQNPV
jgi:hypothetical protein